MKYGFIVVSLLALMTAACNGGKGLPAARSPSQVSGNAVDALIVNGSIAVYSFADGVKGELLASGATDETGAYSLDVAAASMPVLLEVTGGSYTEEATGTSVPLQDGQVLRALTHYEYDQPLTVMVTPFTNIAAGLAQWKIGQGVNVGNAITEATTAISAGFVGVDIIGTYPRNITEQLNYTTAINDEYRYGFLSAAISNWTAEAARRASITPHSALTSIDLAQIMYNDIRADGRLDGLDAAGQVAFGAEQITVDTYRTEFAIAMLQIAADPANKTGLSGSDVLSYAQQVASTTHSVFAGTQAPSIDAEGPAIAWTEAEGVYKAGVIEFAPSVTDFVGVASVTASLNGGAAVEAADPAAPAFSINTADAPDGNATITVTATDLVGNVSTMDYAFIVDNTVMRAVVSSPAYVNSTAYTISGTLTDAGAGVGTVTVNGIPATLDTAGLWSASLTLSWGVNALEIIVTDTLGNTATQAVNVRADRAPASLGVAYGITDYQAFNGTIYQSGLDSASVHSDPVYVPYTRLDMTGTQYARPALDAGGFPYMFFTVSDPVMDGVTSAASALELRYQYMVNGVTVKDWTTMTPKQQSAIDRGYLLPLTAEYLGNTWHQAAASATHTINIEAVDEGGNVTAWTRSFKVAFDLQDIVFNTLTASANVNLYDYTNGLRGGLVSTCQTDSTGRCTVALLRDPSPALAELVGGNYSEWYNGQGVNLGGEKQRAAFVYAGLDSQDVTITPFTNVEAGLVESAIANGQSAAAAIASAQTSMGNLYGFSLTGTVPVDPTDPASITATLTDGHKYGLLLAGLSGYAAQLSTDNAQPLFSVWNSVTTAGLMYRDATDGLLDGMTPQGPAMAGVVPLDANTYRAEVLTHTLAFSSGPDNLTGLVGGDLLAWLDAVNNNTAAMFAGQPTAPYDATAPTIVQNLIADTWHNGTLNYSATVSDLSGIASVVVMVDGVQVGTAASVAIDTTAYADGTHLIEIAATDSAGNVATDSIALNFDNTAPTMNVTSNALVNTVNHILAGTATDAGAGLFDVLVDGQAAGLDVSGVWNKNIILADGHNTVSVVVSDVLGNSRSYSVSVGVDRQAPLIQSDYSNATYRMADGTTFVEPLSSALVGTYPVAFSTDALNLAPTAYDTNAMSTAGIPFFSSTVTDPASSGTETAASNLVVEYRLNSGGVIMVPWTAINPIPESVTGNGYVIPLVNEWLGDAWHYVKESTQHSLDVRVTDAAGNVTVKSYTFRASVQAPKPTATITNGGGVIGGTTFANRSTLAGKTETVATYKFTNTTPYPLYVAVNDKAGNAYSGYTAVEKGIRSNQVKLRTVYTWQATTVNYSGLDCTPATGYVPAAVTTMYDWNGSSWVAISPPATVTGAATSVTSDNPTPPAATTNTVQPSSPYYQSPSTVYFGKTQTYYFDLARAADGSNVSYNAPAPGNSCSHPGLYGLEETATNSYVQVAGYPKNTFTNVAGVSKTMTNPTFSVTVGGSAATPTGGLYLLQPGVQMVITKKVTLPTLTVKNHTDVANRATFSSYTARYLDLHHTFSMARPIEVELRHARTQTEADNARGPVYQYSSGSLTRSVAR